MPGIDQRYQDERYKNWLSCVNGLRALRCLLRSFIEDQTKLFHCKLVDHIGTDKCVEKCEITRNPKQKELPVVCEVCTQWSYALLENHCAQGSLIHWSNCNPQRWPEEKWEASKVYMPGGHKTHVKFDDFDIAALINLMSRCTHFLRLLKANKPQKLLDSVTEVRNQVMHSPDFSMSKGDLKKHLDTIKRLGRVLEPYAPEMKSLPEEIDKGTGEQSLEEFKQMELLVITEEISFISVSFSDVPTTHSEERSLQLMMLVDSLWTFMEQRRDLQEALSIQMAQLLSLRDHKEQLMQALAKVQENQKLIDKQQKEIEKGNSVAMKQAIHSHSLSTLAIGMSVLAIMWNLMH